MVTQTTGLTTSVGRRPFRRAEPKPNPSETPDIDWGAALAVMRRMRNLE
jgi:hypothetical protein